MSTRHEVTRGPGLRAALHLAAVLSLVAGLDAVVPKPSSAATAGKTPWRSASASHRRSGEKVNINTAPLKDLEELPGVGTVMAQRIMAGRPYQSVQELRRAGIPPNTVRGLLGVVTAGRAAPAGAEKAPRASAARAPEARAAAAGVKSNNAPSAHKSPPQRTFFGIPIGGPWRPASKVEPAPKAEPAPAARAADRGRSTSAPRAVASERVPAAEPPAEGMVWADPDLKVFYLRGDRHYGTTRHGRYLWEDQAVREGYRAPKAGPRQ